MELDTIISVIGITLKSYDYTNTKIIKARKRDNLIEIITSDADTEVNPDIVIDITEKGKIKEITFESGINEITRILFDFFANNINNYVTNINLDENYKEYKF